MRISSSSAGPDVQSAVEPAAAAAVEDCMAAAPRLPKPLLAVAAAALAVAGNLGFVASPTASRSGLGTVHRVGVSCAGMSVHVTTGFDAEIAGYAVNGVDLSNIPPGCRTKRVSVLFDSRNGSGVGAAVRATLPASGATDRIAIRPRSNAIAASRIAGVSIVVS